MVRIQVILMGIVALSLFSCKESQKEGDSKHSETVNSGVPNFDEFYQKFHSDSIYQLNHIVFPLEGMPGQAGEQEYTNPNFRWQKEDWVIHKGFQNINDEFSLEFRPIDETLMIEVIRHKASNYIMKRHFAYMDDGWYLIYYAGLNKTK